jgi:hypothetical protein
LSQGQTKTAALRSAKLAFLRSGSPMQRPQYWAAFVLNGDGWNRGPRVVGWSILLAGAGMIVGLSGLALRAGRQKARTE